MTHPHLLHRWLQRAWQELRERASRPVTIRGGGLSSVFDVPAELPKRTAVLVAKGQAEQWLIFDCPCRVGHRVMLNVDPTVRPTWRIVDRNRLTLQPSVNEVTENGRCHYFIRKGRVTWV